MSYDPIEATIECALLDAGIQFIRDGAPGNQDTGLDFLLPESGVYIECKQFHTERSNEQLARADNVILIQGRDAAHAFARMLTARP